MFDLGYFTNLISTQIIISLVLLMWSSRFVQDFTNQESHTCRDIVSEKSSVGMDNKDLNYFDKEPI